MKEVTIECNGFWLRHTQNKLLAHVNIMMKHTPIYNRHDVFKPGARHDWFLEISFVCDASMCVCVSALEAINN